jgi:LysM domain
MILGKSLIILGLTSLIVRTSLLPLIQPAGAIIIAQSSCVSGSLYTFKSGDTLFLIAQDKLGDGNRWREIKKVDGSTFTDAEVANLQPGQQICIPGSNPSPIVGKGDFKQMLESLGAFESGKPSGDPNQYRAENQLGFMGKYQFGEPLLIDLGYYQAKTFYGNGADKNNWLGTWTGKNGINSKEQFLNSPQVQEIAIREAFNLNWQRLNNALAAKGQSIDNYLGKQKIFTDKGVQKTVTISISGILAGAHLRGPGGVANLLLNNQVSYDENGTSILRYMEEYGGYKVTVADFSNTTFAR